MQFTGHQLTGKFSQSCVVVTPQFTQCSFYLDRLSVEFPAGLIDSGESLEQAALRELAEETGYDATIKVRTTA